MARYVDMQSMAIEGSEMSGTLHMQGFLPNEASSIFKCEVIFPDFLDNNKSDSNGKPYTDFNDLHQACGIKEVLRQIKRLDNRQRI